MKFIPVYTFFVFGYFFGQTQHIHVLKGKLTNQTTGSPIPYASVWIKNSEYGVASNDDGLFELPVPQQYQDDSLYISSLGFLTYKEKIDNLPGENFLFIELKESVYQLAEITFKALDPETLLKTAIEKVPEQFEKHQPQRLEYYYRSTTKENDRYAYFIESAFRLTVGPDKKNPTGSFKLEYRASRQSNNFRKSHMARPFITPNVIFKWKIPISNPGRLEKLIQEDAWLYELDYSTQNGELVYIVRANINPARYPGNDMIRGRDIVLNYTFYIRERDYAILRIDYGLGDYAKRLLPEGVPSHLRLEASEDGILIFKLSESTSYLQYYHVEVGYKWYEAKSGKLITEGLEKNEAIMQEDRILVREDLPLKKGQHYSIPVMNYDSLFWSKYILKDQIPLDHTIIKDLEKNHVSIDDQFEGNSVEWWNPIILKKLYKKFSDSPPKVSLKGNVGFTLAGFSDAKFVAVSGSFNNWNPVQYFLERNSGGWFGRLNIPPGKYEYRFNVGGKWISEPGDRISVSENSILFVD